MAQEATIKRILVALDDSSRTLAAAEAAAELAARLHAELQGLFVEDINLVRLAGLPFARVVYASTADSRLDAAVMERSLRAQAQRLRIELGAAAQRRKVTWSFRVVRGQVVSELLAAAREVDLLLLGKSGRPARARLALGSTARSIAALATCSVLLLHPGVALERPVAVLLDEAGAAGIALATGARLAQHDDKNLLVLIFAAQAQDFHRIAGEAEALLRSMGLQARLRRVSSSDAAALAQALREEGSRVLVVGAASPLLQRPDATDLLEKVHCPVVLVR